MARPNPYNDPHHRQALRDTVQRITRTLHELTDLFQTFYELFDEDVDRQTSAERHATLFSVDLTATTPTQVAPSEQVPVQEPKWRMEKTRRRNRAWTDEENTDLRVMFKHGMSDRMIGEFLGRSHQAVGRQRLALNLRKEA